MQPPPRDPPDRYAVDCDYEWNYAYAPTAAVPPLPEPPVEGSWTFCGLPVASPLGISAGPLLNGRWVLHYAGLGFDVLTYKTVRSRSRPAYAAPNLVPVATGPLSTAAQTVRADSAMHGSWAISFGMPSREPATWQADVQWTREQLPRGKLLSVSVVATPSADWTLARVAADYAQCARWAVDSGADCVELNFSCPNVASCDGQLYQHAEQAAIVAHAVRDVIPRTPLLVKIGYLADRQLATALLTALGSVVDALSMTNCISAQVTDQGKPLFAGQPRGIGGAAIFAASVAQVRMFHELVGELQLPTRLIGVGGVDSTAAVRSYLAAGAEAVQLATAAMLDPRLGQRLRADLSASQ